MTEPWTIKRLLSWSTTFLQDRDAPSPRLDAQILLGHVTGLDKVQLYVQFERPLSSGELQVFKDLLKRRAAGEPVAYILGKKEFYGRDFSVGPGVLVPRPETEHLIDAVLAHVAAAGVEVPRIVDVGTGSGAIAVTLACELEAAVVVGVDISAAALDFARINAVAHDVRDRVKLAAGDLLLPIRSAGTVDVVASNPPYLDDALMASLPITVRDFEPRGALYGGADGTDLIARLAEDALRVLKPGGLLVVETAGPPQCAQVAAMFEASGYVDVRVIDDYSRRGRMVAAVKSSV